MERQKEEISSAKAIEAENQTLGHQL